MRTNLNRLQVEILTDRIMSPTRILLSFCANPPSVNREIKIPSQSSLNDGDPFPPAIENPRPCPNWSLIRVV